MRKKKEVKEYNICTCLSCEGNPEFDHPEMMKHLSEKHGIDSKSSKGTREMLMHMDGEDFYTWRYKWTLDAGVTFEQETCNKRRHNFGFQPLHHQVPPL